MSRDELQRQSLEAALRDVGMARVAFDDVAGWVAAAGASPADPLAAEVWVFDTDLSQVLLVRHRWRAWVPPGGQVEPGRRPARQHVVSCAKRPDWMPISSPSQPPSAFGPTIPTGQRH